jgi:hypothetical protein
MTTGKLVKGPIYMMMVVGLEQKRTYQKAGATVYVHHVTFVDQAGVQYIGEYPVATPTQDAFVKGKMSPQFKVTLEGKYGNEINLADFVYKPRDPEPTEAAPQPGKGSDAIMPMGGQSYVFAMGFAKDIIVANMSDYDGQTDSNYKEDLFKLADEINQWLIDKQREQQFNQM